PQGTVADQQDFSFVPTDNGTYVATVVVTDDDGGPITVHSQTITVTNVAPTATITGAPVVDGHEGSAISVGSDVVDPGTADTHTYAWSVTKDNVAFPLPGVVTTDSSFSFVPTDNGVYVIHLTVVDDDLAATVIHSDP